MGGEKERISRLEDEVSDINRRLGRIESMLEQTVETSEKEQKESEDRFSRGQQVKDAESVDKDETDRSESGFPNFETEVGLKWLGRIGVLAFVLGIAFSIRYAIQEELIGYTARIILGLAIGIGLGAIGWFAKEKYKGYERWGRTLMGGGAAITYFAVYATYHFESYRQALGVTLEQNVILLSIVALATFGIALKDNSRVFAAESLTMGYATAYMGTGIGYYILIYVSILAAGVAALSYYKKWPGIQLYGVLATFAIYPLWRPEGAYDVGLIFLSSILALFTASNIGMLYRKDELEDTGRLMATISIYALPLIYAAIMHFELNDQGIEQIYVVYFGVFVLQTVMYYVAENLDAGLKEHYIYSAVPFAIAAAILYFSELWSTVVLALISILAVIASFQTSREEIRYAGYTVSIGVLYKTLAYDTRVLEGLNFADPLESTRLFAYLSVIAAFTLIYILVRINRETLHQKERSNLLMEKAYSWAIAILVLSIIGLELEVFRVSLLWGIYGIYLLILGMKLRLEYFRQQSIAVLAVTTFKVFIIDTAGLDTLSRTLSFLVLGLVLIVASYIYTNYREELEEVVG